MVGEQDTPARARALLISAPASGSGKTSVTAALARRLLKEGRRVRAFKVGPDFLDPMVLEAATGAPVYQLDLWMVGERACARRLYEAAREADVLLVEGAMGLYDGEPSSADLAERFALPIAVVIDASAMAQTFAALARGLLRFRPLPVGGVIANRVAGDRHAAMLTEALPADIPSLGMLPRLAEAVFPERHLGLVQAEEVADLQRRIALLAEAWTPGQVPWPPPSEFASVPKERPPPLLENVRIAVAKDAALSFLYRANLELLEEMGAQLAYFSILDGAPPACDALYLPGGYPELHAEKLAANKAMKAAVQRQHQAGRPIVAECGGMMCLGRGMALVDGTRHEMCGLLPVEISMQRRLAAIGLQEIRLPEGTLRGHTFHYSRMDADLAPLARAKAKRSGVQGEAVYRVKRLTASYLHLYFPSNPSAAAMLFRPDGVAP